MKKMVLLFICSVIGMMSVFAETSQWISAKKVELKSSAGWFGDTVATASYGDEVTVISVNGKWVQVKTVKNAKTGWIPASSITKKKIVATNGKVSADAKEISLAGKGFSTSLEDEYKENAKTDYSQVDAIEKITVTNADEKKFLQDGKLKGAE